MTSFLSIIIAKFLFDTQEEWHFWNFYCVFVGKIKYQNIVGLSCTSLPMGPGFVGPARALGWAGLGSLGWAQL